MPPEVWPALITAAGTSIAAVFAVWVSFTKTRAEVAELRAHLKPNGGSHGGEPNLRDNVDATLAEVKHIGSSCHHTMVRVDGLEKRLEDLEARYYGDG